MSTSLRVPVDLRRRIEDAAADMGVPPAWVLRAAIVLALRTEDAPMLDLVIAVEDVGRATVRMPRYRRAAADSNAGSAESMGCQPGRNAAER